MPIKAPRAKRKAQYHHGDLKRSLLEAAEAELVAKGVEGFSLRGVAKQAGVSHAAPAHHFGDAAGLLTALAANGYQRFLKAQLSRQQIADPDPRAQLAASGLGYIDFATQNPALFRLMFASERPDRSSPSLADGANRAFEKLVDDVSNLSGNDPHADSAAMTQVLAAWTVVHGLSDLLIADRLGRASFLADLPMAKRDEVFSQMILQAIGSPPG